MPACMPFVGGAAVDGSVVLVSGGGNISSNIRLAPGATTWELVAKLAAPRMNLAVAALGHDIYVLVRRHPVPNTWT